jgi:hypothetical protein
VQVRGDVFTLLVGGVQKAQATIASTAGNLGTRFGGAAAGTSTTLVHLDNIRVQEL